jgi:hypothetical protein
MSVGIEELDCSVETQLEGLLQRADRAMYEKKKRRSA